MLLPKIADVAARRPSRPATRKIVAVPGPGVIVTTIAIARNPHGERMNESLRSRTTTGVKVMGTAHGQAARLAESMCARL